MSGHQIGFQAPAGASQRKLPTSAGRRIASRRADPSGMAQRGFAAIRWTGGGGHVPSPGGRIDGGSVFGQ